MPSYRNNSNLIGKVEKRTINSNNNNNNIFSLSSSFPSLLKQKKTKISSIASKQFIQLIKKQNNRSNIPSDDKISNKVLDRNIIEDSNKKIILIKTNLQDISNSKTKSKESKENNNNTYDNYNNTDFNENTYECKPIKDIKNIKKIRNKVLDSFSSKNIYSNKLSETTNIISNISISNKYKDIIKKDQSKQMKYILDTSNNNINNSNISNESNTFSTIRNFKYRNSINHTKLVIPKLNFGFKFNQALSNNNTNTTDNNHIKAAYVKQNTIQLDSPNRKSKYINLLNSNIDTNNSLNTNPNELIKTSLYQSNLLTSKANINSVIRNIKFTNQEKQKMNSYYAKNSDKESSRNLKDRKQNIKVNDSNSLDKNMNNDTSINYNNTYQRYKSLEPSIFTFNSVNCNSFLNYNNNNAKLNKIKNNNLNKSEIRILNNKINNSTSTPLVINKRLIKSSDFSSISCNVEEINDKQNKGKSNMANNDNYNEVDIENDSDNIYEKLLNNILSQEEINKYEKYEKYNINSDNNINKNTKSVIEEINKSFIQAAEKSKSILDQLNSSSTMHSLGTLHTLQNSNRNITSLNNQIDIFYLNSLNQYFIEASKLTISSSINRFVLKICDKLSIFKGSSLVKLLYERMLVMINIKKDILTIITNTRKFNIESLKN